MQKFRRLVVPSAVCFVLMFCFGTSVQAATEITEQLRGPEPQPGNCEGPGIGTATIEHKDQDLAQIIVGKVLDKDKSDDSLIVTLRLRNGPPNTRFGVSWHALDMPGVCYPIVGGLFLGFVTTDARGSLRERYRLPAGNPFPGNSVKIKLCANLEGPTNACDDGDPIINALFTEVFPPAP